MCNNRVKFYLEIPSRWRNIARKRGIFYSLYMALKPRESNRSPICAMPRCPQCDNIVLNLGVRDDIADVIT